MPDLSLGTVRLAYALGGLLTAAWVASFGARRLWPWLADNRPETLEDWVLAPMVGFIIRRWVPTS